jgi:Fe-S cluster biogenesis protein NfuA
LIREKVGKWCSESESTLQKLVNTKQQLIEMVEESKEVERKSESDLLKDSC